MMLPVLGNMLVLAVTVGLFVATVSIQKRR
jgi:hypothetical protein